MRGPAPFAVLALISREENGRTPRIIVMSLYILAVRSTC